MELLIFQNHPCEDAALAGDVFTDLGWTQRVVQCHRGERPDAGPAGDALLVLGGPMNVYEEAQYPFLAWETEWIREWAQAGRPMLGLCLGAQLLSKALGGKVTANPVREIGHYTVALTRDGKKDPVFQGFLPEFPVVQWHGDTFTIPEGAVWLAGSALCQYQAMRYKHAIGLQFHLEIGRVKMSAWIDAYCKPQEHAGIDVPTLLLGFEQREAVYAGACRRLIENFCRYDCGGESGAS
jgi:GMP synthase (glutamine-hydrolysing)